MYDFEADSQSVRDEWYRALHIVVKYNTLMERARRRRELEGQGGERHMSSVKLRSLLDWHQRLRQQQAQARGAALPGAGGGVLRASSGEERKYPAVV
jgi:hypothetical protein